MPSEIKIYNDDCMVAMHKMKDKEFDLAIVDPPYGGGQIETMGSNKRSRFGGIFDKYKIECSRTGGGWANDDNAKKIKHWDIAPDMEYFEQLFRVSKNQIIWGGNYFLLPPTRCFLVWRKLTISESFTMAMCEYAWTSFNDNAKWIEIAPQGNAGKQRFHPTQKPEKLYAWQLNNYAQKGFKILDTHLGSGSIAIACYDMGFDLVGYEIDESYFKAAVDRLERHKKQITFFDGDAHEVKNQPASDKDGIKTEGFSNDLLF